jgi:malonyl-CoA/methylmalonyl-CoA synthetase
MLALLEDDVTVENAIEATVRSEMAGFKRPRRFEIVSELPRNTMGKVQKNQLRDQFADAFQPLTT